MKNLLAASLLLWSFSQPIQAQTKKEVLEYRMPPDVERRKGGYRISQSRGEVGYEYFSNKTRLRVAFEKYEKGVLVERKLYDPDQPLHPYMFQLHGVQKQWYPNGVLKKWSPYFLGTKDGVFKEWDEKGQKVAQYTLKEGTGVAPI